MKYPIQNYLHALLDQLKYGWQGRWQSLRQWTSEQPRWKLIAIAVGTPLAAGLLLVTMLYAGVRMGWYGALPTTEQLTSIRNDEASSVFSADGELLGKYFVENRINADLTEIPQHLIDALIATEDARFFEHGGVDFRALFRVAFKSILLQNESSGGGSTLSQQLAKNLYPRREFSFLSMAKNKLREMVVAARLENVYSKEQLLVLYLNTVPFGDNAFGIKVAAKRFFNSTLEELTTEEGATLIGILKGNTLYNPRRNPSAARSRRNLILGLMAKAEQLDTAILDSLRALPIVLDYRPEGHNQGPATYFREHLRHELTSVLENFPDEDGRVYDLYRDGLRIFTTIDARMQDHAEAAVAEVMPKVQANLAADWKSARSSPWEAQFQSHLRGSRMYQRYEEKGMEHEAIVEKLREPHSMTIFDWKRGGAVDTLLAPIDSLRHYYVLLNAGLLATEAKTGIVKAWVGGVDHEFVQYDHVKSRRQVGSTIKPVVYATALEAGMRPCEYTPAERFTYEDYNNYNPGNPNGDYEGVYSMRGGLAKSINTVAVNIAVRTGLQTVADKARSMGLRTEVKAIPSLALGTVEANLMEMTQVYSSFANGGRRPQRLHYLDRIETADGEVIVEFERPTATDFTRVLSDSTSALTTFLLAGVVNGGTAARLRSTYGLRGALAGKTGTTQDQSDGWFMGYTPKLVVGSWVGAEYPAVHFRTLSRGSATATALPVWGSFMRRVTRDDELKEYRGGGFPTLDEMTLAFLQCPDYLEEMPVVNFDSLRGDVRLREVDPARLFDAMENRPRRENESIEDYADRINRELEKEERREERRSRRKEFWGKVLFGNKKSDGK